MEACRAIRDMRTDLSELLRVDRDGHHRGVQTRAARRVLENDPGAAAVLAEVLAPPDEVTIPPAVWRYVTADSRVKE